jgi:hypothetical protein
MLVKLSSDLCLMVVCYTVGVNMVCGTELYFTLGIECGICARS